MATIVVKQFGGLSPKTPPRYLQDTQAQDALNCPAWLGSLTGLLDTTFVRNTDKAQVKSIYRFGQDINEAERYWFEFTQDTDVVRGAVAGDTEERTYFTDGVKPKKTNNVLALSGVGSYPRASYDLGVKPPTTRCSVNVTGGTSGTGGTGGTGGEGGEGGEEGEEEIVEVVPAGIPETRVYTYTFVTAWGEESQPASPSSSVDVMTGQSVSIGMLETPGGGAHNITRKRIYRLAQGHSSAEYLFVAEIAAATTTFVDSVLSADLGEPCPSISYAMPPDTLKGLVALPNGGMAGFSGIDLYFAEPFKPYAWPAEYMQSVDFPIVGLGVMDTTVAVLTTGVPYFAQGSSPENVVLVRSDIHQACVSKRSIVSMNQSVFYASPDGIVAISPSGSGLITDSLFTREQWQALNPATIHAYQWESKYVAFFEAGGGFIFDPVTKTFVPHDISASAGYNDLQRDALYLVDANQMHTWYSGAPKSYIWRSKRWTLPKPIFFSCAAVQAESYPVTFKLFLDGQLAHTQQVISRVPFRLPPGLHEDAEFEITGDTEVFAVMIAQSMQELSNV